MKVGYRPSKSVRIWPRNHTPSCRLRSVQLQLSIVRDLLRLVVKKLDISNEDVDNICNGIEPDEDDDDDYIETKGNHSPGTSNAAGDGVGVAWWKSVKVKMAPVLHMMHKMQS